MPREAIQGPGPYYPKVGWASDREMQLGIETDDGRSMFWALFGSEDAKSNLADLVRQIPDELPMLEYAEAVLNALDTASFDQYQGLWADLNRTDCNRLIRLLRRARDAAYGADA